MSFENGINRQYKKGDIVWEPLGVLCATKVTYYISPTIQPCALPLECTSVKIYTYDRGETWAVYTFYNNKYWKTRDLYAQVGPDGQYDYKMDEENIGGLYTTEQEAVEADRRGLLWLWHSRMEIVKDEIHHSKIELDMLAGSIAKYEGQCI